MSKIIILIPTLLMAGVARAQNLTELINMAYAKNPGLMASKASHQAQRSLVTSKASFADPVVGLATLDRNVETKYAMVTQKFRFPVKYYLQAKAQSNLAKSYKAKYDMAKFNVRSKVISLYYSIYSVQKIIELTKTNIRAVKEFSRVAEKKYAAGRSSQSDSMKSHFELTKLELDLIRLGQEEAGLQEELYATVNSSHFKKLNFSKINLRIPNFEEQKISSSMKNLTTKLRQSSPKLKKEIHLLKQASDKSNLAKWEFAPDIKIQYQQRISGDPEDSKIYSVGLELPIWFWSKGAKASAASSKEMAQEYKVSHETLILIAKIKGLKGKVSALKKTLEVYKTSLIPQALGAFNSTRAGYRANKSSFLSLLDSERALYGVKTGYYNSLRQYAEKLSHLESSMGFTVSNLTKEVIK